MKQSKHIPTWALEIYITEIPTLMYEDLPKKELWKSDEEYDCLLSGYVARYLINRKRL